MHDDNDDDGDDEICANSSSQDMAEPQPKRRKRPKLSLSGPLILVLLISDSVGLWSNAGPMGMSPEISVQSYPDSHIVGLALTQ